MRILIVDDSEDIRHFIESLLQSAGYVDVLTAGSAKEALQLLSADTRIDLILMDILMPEMDGIEFCKRLKKDKLLRVIPIIMVTASTEAKNLDRAFKAGAIDYITKPFERIELIARVRSALRLKTEMDMCKAWEAELSKKNDELKLALEQINDPR